MQVLHKIWELAQRNRTFVAGKHIVQVNCNNTTPNERRFEPVIFALPWISISEAKCNIGHDWAGR